MMKKAVISTIALMGIVIGLLCGQAACQSRAIQFRMEPKKTIAVDSSKLRLRNIVFNITNTVVVSVKADKKICERIWLQDFTDDIQLQYEDNIIRISTNSIVLCGKTGEVLRTVTGANIVGVQVWRGSAPIGHATLSVEKGLIQIIKTDDTPCEITLSSRKSFVIVFASNWYDWSG